MFFERVVHAGIQGGGGEIGKRGVGGGLQQTLGKRCSLRHQDYKMPGNILQIKKGASVSYGDWEERIVEMIP